MKGLLPNGRTTPRSRYCQRCMNSASTSYFSLIGGGSFVVGVTNILFTLVVVVVVVVVEEEVAGKVAIAADENPPC